VRRVGTDWCIVDRMTRITVDVNDEWLEAAREELGTDTKVATINAALRAFSLRRQAVEIVAAFDSVEMDFDATCRRWSTTPETPVPRDGRPDLPRRYVGLRPATTASRGTP